MTDYVLYHSSWCPFCRAFVDHFRSILPGSREELLDDPDDPRWSKLNLEYVPTVIEYDGGRERRRLMAEPMVGIRREEFISWLGRS